MGGASPQIRSRLIVAQVLLLDEVTVDLDVLVRSRLLDWLEHETKTRNVTVLYAVRPS